LHAKLSPSKAEVSPNFPHRAEIKNIVASISPRQTMTGKSPEPLRKFLKTQPVILYGHQYRNSVEARNNRAGAKTNAQH
jgi:hypothetical protein